MQSIKTSFVVVLSGLISVTTQTEAGGAVENSVENKILWLGKFNAPTTKNTHDAEISIPWQLMQLDKRVPATHYQMRLWDGVPAIEAIADKSMTLLARPVEINLAKAPILCWRWRVDSPLVQADMATKKGDDYTARVYVAFKLPPEMLSFTIRTKLAIARKIYGDVVPDAAINYVWDNRYEIGTQRPNAYTNRTQMIVQQTGSSKANTWVSERRDLMADFKATFGANYASFGNVQIALVAVASDTDNTGEKAHAGFADIHLVTKDQECKFS
ncbi:MAG: DUF3047 domain-containing protein [Methylotenera sp.]|uniref:DUF3047 domain-containing protein n=1 Tax=Methylotenera sp. TaxID=2051956 RepID=UPI002488C4A4|nr:DUF3047 domain-containing protein [Methylotenera sp.]MDI1309320.1 DUF3047 domain-containing protein [Methylotenera sp.]